MAVYNKLVRDLIPEIIEKNGVSCSVKTLTDEEYIKMLDLKLDEEVAEYKADLSLDELADIVEVIYAISSARGHSPEELEHVRLKKRNERGGFEKKIFLIETSENKQ